MPAGIIGAMPTHPLVETLQHSLRDAAPRALCVAFSGGPDSTALLHALASLPEARRHHLRALHVDHGLHPDSADWARHCADVCRSLDIALTTLRVEVDVAGGEGVEAAARHARYAAFAANLHAGEWLTLAHHRDDQVETILLKLLRGAGPEGLGGMRTLRPFAGGNLWRPLLETPRVVLRNYLLEKELSSIDDPANGDPRFGRTLLRHSVLSTLEQHWPGARAAILHSARLCSAAAEYIAHAAGAARLELLRDAGSLDAAGWLALHEALRAAVLDGWLHARGLTAPPDPQRAELARQVAQASPDRVPLLAWPGVEVRIWDGRLHSTPPLAAIPDTWQAMWNGMPLTLPPGCGTLTLEPARHAAHASDDTHLTTPLTVRFRRGGERIKPAGNAHTRELRDLFQQTRMPPWLRTRCPLMYDDDELIAVADLWVSARGREIFAACGVVPRWLRPPWA